VAEVSRRFDDSEPLQGLQTTISPVLGRLLRLRPLLPRLPRRLRRHRRRPFLRYWPPRRPLPLPRYGLRSRLPILRRSTRIRLLRHLLLYAFSFGLPIKKSCFTIMYTIVHTVV